MQKCYIYFYSNNLGYPQKLEILINKKTYIWLLRAKNPKTLEVEKTGILKREKITDSAQSRAAFCL